MSATPSTVGNPNAPRTPPPAGPEIEDRPDLRPAPLDFDSPQLTLRAIATGMFLGAVLSTCNVYSGLKVGWSFNMSISAALLSYAFWMTLSAIFGTRKWSMLENNINQTAASSGASVSSAGLVAPIPALTMLTGETLSWPWLSLWVFSVCTVGITLAVGLRRQMILTDKLPFPSGIATAETLRELYAKWSEGVARVAAMAVAALVAGGAKIAQEVMRLTDYVQLPLGAIGGFSPKSLTLMLDPNLIMYGVGGLIGMRAAVSLLIGAVLAWGVLGAPLIHMNWARLEIAEPLPILPAAVTLAPEPEAYLSYDGRKRELKFKGVMSAGERDAFLAQSGDTGFREAVEKLYIRSQLDKSAVATQRAGVTTTRRVQIHEPLADWPAGLVLPQEFGHQLRYVAPRKALVASGAISDECLAAVEARVAAIRATVPEAQAVADAARRLFEKGKMSLLPAAAPAELAQRLRYDDDAKTLTVTGPLSPNEKEMLVGLAVGDAGFKATVDDLALGASLPPANANFRDVVTWLLWPGVTMMVVASLASFAFSWRSILSAFPLGGSQAGGVAASRTDELPMQLWVLSIVLSLALSVVLQVTLFQIAIWIAILGVLLSSVLAVVGARVAGETNTTPVGAMGKVTQLMFGALAPGQYAPNLMAANVTGGAASQCADLMFDLKTGHMIGASPWKQFVGQLSGAFAGSMFGCFVYLLLIPNPADQLITEQWAAPAVATWKAVAELFKVGLHALPAGAVQASAIAAALALVLTFAEQYTPKKYRWLVLSPASLGLAFVVQANSSFSMFIGALVAAIVGLVAKNWAARFLTAICAGIIAGDSLTGVGVALKQLLLP